MQPVVERYTPTFKYKMRTDIKKYKNNNDSSEHFSKPHKLKQKWCVKTKIVIVEATCMVDINNMYKCDQLCFIYE